ncbi:hypothetical protein K437DRAFT_86423 [Tilletiaria anomala UBC 951]|uniref:AP complex mu/sigma subunit domain-containing protein n=1 Tax=Tilletiaria anomala (strain ATCC 24038 / CBS 436.72 / UBC 951) TaxID=1037660 RepID=A0A066W7F9_TILAU|nr:uncharacterized protein K437DRAFT_86423 [Tilletiaria anomala UBC 951]KDN48468.1 hypothetical protein K437DRAFT_86423 [Tilletiaria anomala UBC 951]
MAIHSVLIFNNNGKPRLTKFYTHMRGGVSTQQSLLKQIYALVSQRPDGVCNFLDAPELRTMLSATIAHAVRICPDGENDAWVKETRPDQLRVIYRHYATLYFVFVVDGSESELGILDLIQVFVESLDRCFENVCELDLIFNFDQVHAILGEMIQGGLVLETNINEIVASAKTINKARKVSAATSGGGGGAASFGTATGSQGAGAGVASIMTAGGGAGWNVAGQVVSWALRRG